MAKPGIKVGFSMSGLRLHSAQQDESCDHSGLNMILWDVDWNHRRYRVGRS